MAEPSYFYSARDPFGEFSNFALYPISLKGKTWPTSEHYFQAQKFAGTKHEGVVLRAKTSGIAARTGRDRKHPLRKDWKSVKTAVMRDVVWANIS